MGGNAGCALIKAGGDHIFRSRRLRKKCITATYNLYGHRAPQLRWNAPVAPYGLSYEKVPDQPYATVSRPSDDAGEPADQKADKTLFDKCVAETRQHSNGFPWMNITFAVFWLCRFAERVI
jgi:hypothetical protein